MKHRYQGTLVALALADALCAPYEGGVLEKLLWKLFSKTKKGEIRYTDDTQMTIDLATSIIKYKGVNQDMLAIQFANSYQWSRGYGPSAAKLLKKIKKGQNWSQLNTKYFKEGSYGNGAAMRIAPIALLFYNNEELLLKATKQSAVITHAHPDAIIGANIIALSIASMLNNQHYTLIVKLINMTTGNYQKKLKRAKAWLDIEKDTTTVEVAQYLGNGIQAINSTVTSLYLALKFLNKDYNELIKFVQKLKGDTDTIAAMAAAIWGAKNGINAIKHPLVERLEFRDKLIELADKIHALTN